MNKQTEIRPSPATAAGDVIATKIPVVKYCSPQLFILGKTVDLVRQDTAGRLKDGAGGLYLWGS